MSDDDRTRSERPQHPAWKVIDSTLVLSAPPWLSVYRDRVELPDGTVIEEFHRVRMRDARGIRMRHAGSFGVAPVGFVYTTEMLAVMRLGLPAGSGARLGTGEGEP